MCQTGSSVRTESLILLEILLLHAVRGRPASSSSQGGQVLFRQVARLEISVGNDMRSLAFSQQGVVAGAHEFVSENNDALTKITDVGPHDQFVVVECGSLVAATSIDQGDEELIVLLHLLVGKAKLAHQVDPPDFKPDEVIRVVNNAHLVSFSVMDADAAFGDGGRRVRGHGGF